MKKHLVLLAALAFTQCTSFNFEEILSHGKKPGKDQDGGKGDPGARDTVVVYDTRDVHVDRENKNTGLGSEVRLYYADAVALLAFDSFPVFPAGKKLVSAELSLYGWSDAAGDAEVTFDLFRTDADWTEGTGHWYVHTGGFHNGYESAYSQFPEYVPPANTTDPVVPSGVLWSTSATLRAEMVKIATAHATLPRDYPWGSYPRLENTGKIAFDLKAFLQDGACSGKPLSLGIRQAPAASGPNQGFAWIYSRNHLDPKKYGPKLTLIFE